MTSATFVPTFRDDIFVFAALGGALTKITPLYCATDACAQALAEILATLHTPDGRVNVPGFYDDVLEVHPWERDELAKLGGDPQTYANFLGIDAFHTPPGYTPFEAVRFLPTLEFNGMGGGSQGEGTKTVIPSKAFAEFSSVKPSGAVNPKPSFGCMKRRPRTTDRKSVV